MAFHIFRIRKGRRNTMPLLAQGEFGLTTDTTQLFIGIGSSNLEIARKQDIEEAKLGKEITIDEHLSETSENVVKNKTIASVIKNIIGGRELKILTVDGWNNRMYSFESSYPATTYNISIQPDSSCTSKQFDAWTSAKIAASASINAIKALGKTPTVDIPIVFEYHRKIL